MIVVRQVAPLMFAVGRYQGTGMGGWVVRNEWTRASERVVSAENKMRWEMFEEKTGDGILLVLAEAKKQ